MREAVRRVDFTPTHIRFWVDGTIEAGSSPSTLTLVSQATGQRFAVEPTPGALLVAPPSLPWRTCEGP